VKREVVGKVVEMLRRFKKWPKTDKLANNMFIVMKVEKKRCGTSRTSLPNKIK